MTLNEKWIRLECRMLAESVIMSDIDVPEILCRLNEISWHLMLFPDDSTLLKYVRKHIWALKEWLKHHSLKEVEKLLKHRFKQSHDVKTFLSVYRSVVKDTFV